MRVLIVIALLLSLGLAGCTDVRTYTFEKERVDQRQQGNRGYLLGDPPPAPIPDEVPKRTLIGVDIEIPVLPHEKVEIPPDEVEVGEVTEVVRERTERQKKTESPVMSERKADPVIKSEKKTVPEVASKEENPEEWVK